VSQFFAPLAEPLAVIWLVMVFGVSRLIWRRQWRCAVWMGTPVLLIFLIGSTPLVNVIVGRAESAYAPTDIRNLAEADAVVALGGGYYLSEYDTFGFSLRSGASRLLTAAELVRQGKAKALVLGGSVPFEGKADRVGTSLVQNWVLTSGLTTVAVTNLGLCANTHDEALRFKELKAEKGWRRVILVTSALHMPRALAVFAAQGITTVPVACDFQAYGVPSVKGSFSPFPRQIRFDVLYFYLHEKIGWWEYRAKGWI
jgi:uncharacterized SAM-binding protein YcdF (DUF218 family)